MFLKNEKNRPWAVAGCVDRLRLTLVVPLSVFFALGATFASAETPTETEARLNLQKEQYDADVKKSIVELQQFRTTQTIIQESGETLRLTALNPTINTWLLLQIKDATYGRVDSFHLENTDSASQTIKLSDGPVSKLIITGKDGVTTCTPWAGEPSSLAEARKSGLPYSPLCDDKIFLRTRVAGSRTNLERTSEFLRDNIWMGETLVGFVKDTFFKDSHMESGDEIEGAVPQIVDRSLGTPLLSENPVIWTGSGLGLTGATQGQMAMGTWYPVTDLPGVFASALQPRAISPEVINGPGKTNWLDSVESRATVYLVAFDLSKFEIGYEVGTDHPRLDWSPRPSHHNWNLPGPDGIGSPAPLVNLGMVSPKHTKRVIATFTGGYKRQHGAFRYGDYAFSEHGRHYGFVVQGVVQSKLHTELSTFYVLDDGTIGMKTWTEADNALLPRIRFARQNGVPILETDTESGMGIPGPLVRHWGPGNWSGSAEAKLRTLRAGACIKQAKGKRFLVYGYFSTATPSAMARTFQAIECSYAMLLDMNAQEHTYLAVYVRREGGLETQHLVPGMGYVDKKRSDGTRIPRFLGFSDNRDFFYLMKREEKE